ncbi:MAG TPA: CinA family protein [Acetobacteraceae bacterium]|nr:CinA family protein [Acetobacteraceae bacterium]
MPLIRPELLEHAATLLEECRARHLMLATAESCTGGLIAAALTAIPGSSDVVERGFITYSNEAKSDLVGVPPALIATHGAVSEPVARAMAEGAVAHSRADIAVSVTGVAGPGGGSAAKPVGLVWFGLARRGRPTLTEHQILPGDRTAIRAATVERAIALIRTSLESDDRMRTSPSPPAWEERKG